MLYAHSFPGADAAAWQPLKSHLANVAGLSARYAACFNAGAWGGIAGLFHDFGKASPEFQKKLHGQGIHADHTSAGAQYLLHSWGREPDGTRKPLGELYARILGYCIAGHHSGLPDYGTASGPGSLAERFERDLPGDMPGLSLVLPSVEELGRLPLDFSIENFSFRLMLFIRALYSCLTDADLLDAEAFYSPGLRDLPTPSIARLADCLHGHLQQKGFLTDTPATADALLHAAESPCGSPERRAGINAARQAVLHSCIDAARQEQGVFSLTVPPGGGKTLSSLAFALEHARTHNLRRVIAVMPSAGIIEQNARIFREILGENTVLEHHCDYSCPAFEKKEDAENDRIRQYRLSSENWDAPVIVTTSAEFFGSLFACRSSRCRKLHNTAQSVVILTEAHMLPLPLLHASVLALRELLHYNVSILLCTASQPALTTEFLPFGFTPENVREIIPSGTGQALSALLSDRAAVQHMGTCGDRTLARALREEEQVLCVVNSRSHAAGIFDLLDGDENSFLLSTRMSPSHRSAILATIQERLAERKTCRVVSTPLIECGVDINFPAVYREDAGPDMLVRSAGRCNRNGESAPGRFFVFTPENGLPAKAADLRRSAAVFRQLKEHSDLFSPAMMRQYFTALYQGVDLDEYNIVKDINNSTLCKFAFRKTAEAYRFKDTPEQPVIIETPESREFIQQLEDAGPISRRTLRALQAYSVSVYPHELARLMTDGRVECLRGCFYIVRGGRGYHEKTGLEIRPEPEFPPQDFLF